MLEELSIGSGIRGPLEDWFKNRLSTDLVDFCCVVSLFYGFEGGRANLRLTIGSDPGDEIILIFLGATRINLVNFSDYNQYIYGLTAVDVSNRGLERINWEVTDYENGVLSLECERLFIRYDNIES